MQHQRLSLRSVLDALGLDAACLPLLEEARLDDTTNKGYAPENVYAAIRTIGAILNVQQRADQLADDLQERIDIITHKLKFITAENKPHVLLLNDTTPLEADAAGYLGELVRLAGGILHTCGASGADREPDILITVNDKPMPQLLAELPEMLAEPQWSGIPAVTNNRIYIMHHRDHLRHPGAQIADDAEMLAEIIHPKHFFFGRDEDAWMKFDWQ